MNDLISKQAVRLIESDSDAYPEVWNESYEKGFCDAINRVIDLPSAQQWIPCSERMPEEIGSYPVWTAPGFGNHFSTSYWDGKEWTLRVVAWMPLPEPYKEETDDPER